MAVPLRVKSTPSHKTKSHVVMASGSGQYKLVRFGQQGVRGAGRSPSSKSQKARRSAYYARHGRTTNKLSARFWSNKVKW